MAKLKSVLIVGGSSFIGTNLALKLRESFKVFATYHSHPIKIPGATCIPFDIVNSSWIKRIVYATVPDIIVYVAGSNNSELMEANQKEAEKMHTSGSANIANLAEVIQPRFIYLSNCYTFDGHRGNYHETDIVLPATVLGKQKLGGENFIRGRCMNHIIIRSSPVYGRGNGKRLSQLDVWRMKLAREQRVEASNLELHSYAPVSGLVDLITFLIEGGPRNKIIHYGGRTKITELQLAKGFAKRFGYNPDLILEKKYAQEETIAQEGPLWDYSLNSTNAFQTLHTKLWGIEEGLETLETSGRLIT